MQNTNRYGSLWNYRPHGVARVLANVLRSRQGFAFDGPTSECLVDPWISSLEAAGVRFRLGTEVERVRSTQDGALVRIDGTWHEFDAAVVATHLADAVDVVPMTDRVRRRAALTHTHCACFTVGLDPAEDVVLDGRVALYSRDGITVLVQPGAHRCVALCVRPASTDPRWVVDRIVDMLDLRRPLGAVHVVDNLDRNRSVYTAEHVAARRAQAGHEPHVHLAGSYLASDYPLDSAENAIRSAASAVAGMRAAYGARLSRPLDHGSPRLPIPQR